MGRFIRQMSVKYPPNIRKIFFLLMTVRIIRAVLLLFLFLLLLLFITIGFCSGVSPLNVSVVGKC